MAWKKWRRELWEKKKYLKDIPAKYSVFKAWLSKSIIKRHFWDNLGNLHPDYCCAGGGFQLWASSLSIRWDWIVTTEHWEKGSFYTKVYSPGGRLSARITFASSKPAIHLCLHLLGRALGEALYIATQTVMPIANRCAIISRHSRPMTSFHVYTGQVRLGPGEHSDHGNFHFSYIMYLDYCIWYWCCIWHFLQSWSIYQSIYRWNDMMCGVCFKVLQKKGRKVDEIILTKCL